MIFQKSGKSHAPQNEPVKRLLQSRDLPVPIYLNAPSIFDLLAIIEDGFSHLTELETSLKQKSGSSNKVEGSVRTNNLFQLLGVSAGGSLSHEKQESVGLVASTQRIHTATSLFAKLRDILRRNDLVTIVDTIDPIPDSLHAGAFVEIEATLQRNPVIDTFDAFGELMNMITTFSTIESEQASATYGPGGAKKHGHPQLKENANVVAMRQIQAMASMLSSSPTIDLIGLLNETEKGRIVVTGQQNYFVNEKYSANLDGQYRIFGKVLQLFRSASEGRINLLRNTTFSHFQGKLFEGLKQSFESAPDAGLSIPELISEIPGPTIHILPLCIYA